MILTANQFIYNGHPSYLYGLRFMWLDEKPETQLVGNKEYSYFEDKTSHTYSVVDSQFKEPLSYPIEIFSNRVLSDPEIRRIYSLYFNLQQFTEMRLMNEDGSTTILNCVLINPERHEYGMGSESGIVGFKATLVMESPFVSAGYKRVVLSAENGWNLVNSSDSHDYIYPDVTVSLPQLGQFSGGKATFSIINKSDMVYSDNALRSSRPITITKDAGSAAEDIVFNPKLGKISDGNGTSVLNRTNMKFIRLVPGTNAFDVSCDTTIGASTPEIESITLTYREDKVIL